jgi:hypothetical protein
MNADEWDEGDEITMKDEDGRMNEKSLPRDSRAAIDYMALFMYAFIPPPSFFILFSYLLHPTHLRSSAFPYAPISNYDFSHCSRRRRGLRCILLDRSSRPNPRR